MTPIPKGPLSALVCIYRPISITPVLSKVFERLIALRFGSFLERSGVLSSHQYSYRKGLGTCDALLYIVCAGQLELDSAAFDRVNHGGCNIFNILILIKISFFVVSSIQECFKRNPFI